MFLRNLMHRSCMWPIRTTQRSRYALDRANPSIRSHPPLSAHMDGTEWAFNTNHFMPPEVGCEWAESVSGWSIPSGLPVGTSRTSSHAN